MSEVETGKRCSKPGCERERASGQRWCKPCRAEDKRLRRAGNTSGEQAGNASGNGEQSAGNTGNTPGAGNDVVAGVETPPVTGLAAAKVRIVALEDEVRRLKRALAEANAKVALPMPYVGRAPTDAVGVSLAGGIGKATVAAPTNARQMGSCGHGQFCGLLACRSAR